MNENKAINEQIGGDHYKRRVIQPIEFIHKNHIPFIEGNIIKYVCRHRDKGKRVDLEKAIHLLRMLLELDYSTAPPIPVPSSPIEVGDMVTLSDYMAAPHPGKTIPAAQVKEIQQGIVQLNSLLGGFSQYRVTNLVKL